MLYLICYDIAQPKRLRKVAKILEDYGLRVQKSFFQCEMKEERMNKMLESVKNIIERRRDSFFVYPICNECSQKTLQDGSGDMIKINSFEIL